MKFCKGKIRVRTREGEKEIDGLITSQGLGTNKTTGDHDGGYNITHLESGMSILSQIPNLKSAKAILKRIVMETGVDWKATGTQLHSRLGYDHSYQVRSLKADPFSKGLVKKIKKIRQGDN